MAANSFQIYTIAFPDPAASSDPNVQFTRVNTNMSYSYLSNFDITTLSTNGAVAGNDVVGLLYVPDLSPTDPCYNASKPLVPDAVTTQRDLPQGDFQRIAVAPWTSPSCVDSYLSSAREQTNAGFLFFLPNNGTQQPPDSDDSTWDLGDGGRWKSQNKFPVYAIPGNIGGILLEESAQYSGNITKVPYGQNLSSEFGPNDYVRLWTVVYTSNGGSLPSLWVFLLVVLGVLLFVIASTSLLMHWIQRRRRHVLRQRVANGEVDLEALGIKRLTVPQDVLDQLPLYTYGTGTPVNRDGATEHVHMGKIASEFAPNGSSKATDVPTPRANTLTQPTCAICLDDFVAASAGTEGTTVRELPCNHIFHPECVDAFLRDNSSLCPMCKKTALPAGYCPRVITNAMVRRERTARRTRPQASMAESERLNDPGASTTTPVPLHVQARASFYGLTHFRSSRRISSAPSPSQHQQQMTDLNHRPTPPPTDCADDPQRRPAEFFSPTSPAAAAIVRSNSVSTPPSAAPIPATTPAQVQPPSNPSRREWARQRAVTMLGHHRAPIDPDAEEAQATPGWKKALRGLFPAIGR